jgi:hypothetical protein
MSPSDAGKSRRMKKLRSKSTGALVGLVGFYALIAPEQRQLPPQGATIDMVTRPS